MSLIHIVMKSSGEWEDSYESVVTAFSKKDDADNYVLLKNQKFAEFRQRYESITTDLNELRDRIFMAYLKEEIPSMFEKYSASEEPNDWDSFFEEQCKFLENTDLVEKYMAKCNVTNKEREDYRVNSEFADRYRENVYYYVSYDVTLDEE